MRLSDWCSDVCSSDLLEFGTRLADMVAQQMLAFEALMRVALRRADVVAGRNVLAVAGEDDDLARVVVNRATECRVERVGHFRIYRVVIARTTHRDRPYTVGRHVTHSALACIRGGAHAGHVHAPPPPHRRGHTLVDFPDG